VDQLLAKLEKVAVALRDGGCDLRTETRLALPVGPLELSSPESMRLRSPDEKLDTRGVEIQTNMREPSEQILKSLESVRIREVAQKAYQTLCVKGPLSIAGLLRECPIEAGLEELVAYLRVAKAVKAPELQQIERVTLGDTNGVQLTANVPAFVLSADLFPDNLDELVL
jgi:hypothetical protein